MQLVSWFLLSLTTLLALRLCRSAYRARSLPEGLMGAFFIGAELGYGILILRQTLQLSVESIELFTSLAGAAFLAPATGVVLFTWQVFRRDAVFARWLALSLTAFAVVSHLLAYWIAAPLGIGHVFSREPGSTFYWLMAIARAGGFAWACSEACLYYRKVRKRIGVGLVDAVVANRFLLWAIWSGAATVMVCLRIVSAFFIDLHVENPVTPVPLQLALIFFGLVCAGAVWLTFAPPGFYRRFIERTGAARAAERAAEGVGPG